MGCFSDPGLNHPFCLLARYRKDSKGPCIWFEILDPSQGCLVVTFNHVESGPGCVWWQIYSLHARSPVAWFIPQGVRYCFEFDVSILELGDFANVSDFAASRLLSIGPTFLLEPSFGAESSCFHGQGAHSPFCRNQSQLGLLHPFLALIRHLSLQPLVWKVPPVPQF